MVFAEVISYEHKFYGPVKAPIVPPLQCCTVGQRSELSTPAAPMMRTPQHNTTTARAELRGELSSSRPPCGGTDTTQLVLMMWDGPSGLITNEWLRGYITWQMMVWGSFSKSRGIELSPSLPSLFSSSQPLCKLEGTRRSYFVYHLLSVETISLKSNCLTIPQLNSSTS